MLRDGDHWLSQRQPMSRYMMMPKMVNLYAEDFNVITQELVDVMEKARDPEKQNMVEDVENVLFKWGFECEKNIVEAFVRAIGILKDIL